MPIRRPAGAPGRSARVRRWIPAVVAAAAVLATGYALRDGLPRPAELAVTLRSARGGWLALAAVAEAASIGMFAGYAFRQFRDRGASSQVAVTVTVVSGVLSVAGLVLLYAVGAVPLAALGPARHPATDSWPDLAATVADRPRGRSP